MCQLLGMYCNTPTDIIFSFDGFRVPAGLTAQHLAGFGILLFEREAARVLHDDTPPA